MAKGGDGGSVEKCYQRVSTGYLKLPSLAINVRYYRLLMFVSPDVRLGACLRCHVSRVHVERRSFTPIIIIPINQDLSLMSNLWIILGFTSEWGKGSHNFHVQDTVSKVSILSFFLGVHKEFILSILS